MPFIRTLFALTLLGSVTLAEGAPEQSLQAAPDAARFDSGRLLIKFRNADQGRTSPRLRAVLGSSLDSARPLARGRKRGPLPGGIDRLFEIQIDPSADVQRLAAKLSRLPEVEYAEPVPIYEIAAVPNDSLYAGGQLAYLNRLQVEPAWDIQKSQNGVPRPVVCIVDGGTNWQHEDLIANMWSNPGEIAGNSVDDDGNGYIDDVRGWNFRDNNNNPRGNPATPFNANHGSLTGGLAAAVTNNVRGMASASWNPLLMAVNASSTSDVSIGHGYEGIIYAADNDADVVSLSWGGSFASQAGQDIVDYATAQGTLVVAAAGNGNTNKLFYPAAYQGVIAVANVQNDDTRFPGPQGSNYGGWLDVAAPGTNVYSVLDNGTTNQYGQNTGTSLACPVASAVAALIKASHPSWSALEVGEQLRVSTDNINSVNPSFQDQLGKGRVNALRALTLVSPAVRVTSWTFQDANANGQLNQGESAGMTLVLHNYHAAAVSPNFTLSSASPWVSITDGSQGSSNIPDDGDVTLPSAFSFTVSPNVPPGTLIELRVDMTASGYTDFQFITVALEPIFETHDINNLEVSLTTTGGIGWDGFPGGFQEDGDGLSFQGGPNLLFEGALLLGTSATKLSDAARASGERTDFATRLHGAPDKLTPGPDEDQEIHGSMSDSINTTTPLGVNVTLSSWARASAPYDDFVIVSYDIQNRTAAPFDSLWAALFFDWDIDENHYATNRVGWDASRRLGYAWDNTAGLPYMGVMTLSGITAGFSAIRNDGVGMPWSVNDGFSKAEKWDVLQGGTGVLAAGPADISNALASGPYPVAAGARVSAFFALIGGTSLADLQANADRAREMFADSITTGVPGEIEGPRMPVAALLPASPNPFGSSTKLHLSVRETREVSVAIYDAQGRRVRELLEGTRTPGDYELAWNGEDESGRRVSSGVYFAQLTLGGIRQVQRLILAK